MRWGCRGRNEARAMKEAALLEEALVAASIVDIRFRWPEEI